MHRTITLGLRPHTGWAAMVAIEEVDDRPRLVERRRITLLDDSLPRQVFHAMVGLAGAEANDFVDGVRASAHAASRTLIEEWIGRDSLGVAVVAWQPTIPDSIDRILTSHQLMHAAEGDLYRGALIQAARDRGVPVAGFLPAELVTTAAAVLGLEPAELTQRIAELGRAAGPPWQKDQKEATMAAWAMVRIMRGADATPSAAEQTHRLGATELALPGRRRGAHSPRRR